MESLTVKLKDNREEIQKFGLETTRNRTGKYQQITEKDINLLTQRPSKIFCFWLKGPSKWYVNNPMSENDGLERDSKQRKRGKRW